MRIIHFLVVCALIYAASYVYRIKMDSTARTERVSRLQAQVREQREAIAVLRAEWAKLDAPRRLQILAERHLKLKPIETRQFDSLKNLPERPPSLVPPDTSDPIGAMIEIDPDVVTGSLPLQEAPQ
ncbi:MAG: hypothetical protein K0Q64_716 [Nitrobacter vulgaris]|nr:hypothetical protein [Nitrobacter vulgaris]